MRAAWIYVRVQIVGNLEHWENSYYWSGKTHRTADFAIAAGIRDLGHDDFCIGKIEGGPAGARLVWWGWQHEQHPDEDRIHAAEGLGLLS